MPISEILSGSEQLQKGRSIPIINTKERPCPSDMITGWMQICQYFILLVFLYFFRSAFRLLRCADSPGSASDYTYVWRQVCDPGGCNPSGAYSCQSRLGEQWRRDRGLSFHDLKFLAL